MKIANAPCSWGTIENVPGARIGYAQMLDELAETGYVGTELGDVGFMPDDPEALRDALASRSLEMVGSWVTVGLRDRARHDDGLKRAVHIARLLRAVGGPTAVVNLGDDHSTDPVRTQRAGRIDATSSVSDADLAVIVEGVERIAAAVREETGLRTGLHHHGGSFIETPREVQAFLDRADPDLVHLVFDSGHWTLGGGDAAIGLDRHYDRVQLVHVKDFDPTVLARADAEGWGYPDLVAHGVFPELGRGVVDFAALFTLLERRGYDGWIVVEQDVVPGLGTPKESAARNRAYLSRFGV